MQKLNSDLNFFNKNCLFLGGTPCQTNEPQASSNNKSDTRVCEN